MAILVTGGAGLLGAAVVHLLLEKGEECPVVLDPAQIPDRLADVGDQIEYIRGDLANFNMLLDVVKKVKPRTIYHLGAMLGGSCEQDPAGAMRVNAMGTFYVLEAARLFDVSQVIFASSGATFGLELQEDILRDASLQRPVTFYGVTKLLGEGMGLFFKRKYGLDFRSIRYPSIVGPGVRAGGVVSYTSAMIEECAKGNPYTANVDPETRVSVVYTADAARATVNLAVAPRENIKTTNYLIDGSRPVLSAGELAGMVRAKIPGAQIDFKPIKEFQRLLDLIAIPIDDSCARTEWGWRPEYDYEKIIDDFLQIYGHSNK